MKLFNYYIKKYKNDNFHKSEAMESGKQRFAECQNLVLSNWYRNQHGKFR